MYQPKHIDESYCVSKSLTKYGGVIFAAVKNISKKDAGGESYKHGLKVLRKNLEDGGNLDKKSCMTELSAAEIAGIEDFALCPALEMFGIESSELHLPSIKELAKSFLEELKRVPKKLLVATLLLGILSNGVLAPNMGGNINSVVNDRIQTAYSRVDNTLERNVFNPLHKTEKYQSHIYDKNAISEKNFEAPKITRKITPYMNTDSASSMKDGIKKALSLANTSLTEERKDTLSNSIIASAKKFNLNPALITGVVITESCGKLNQTSNKGARGLMQVTWAVHGPALKKHFGFRTAEDLQDTNKGLLAGCWVLKGYLERSDGDIKRGLSRYYGSNQVEKYYGKVMRWAGVVQKSGDGMMYVYSLAKKGYTETEAKAVLKATVALGCVGPMDSRQLFLCLNSLSPSSSTEKIADMAKFIIGEGRVSGGLIKGRKSNILESLFLLGKTYPGYNPRVCAVELASALSRQVGNISRSNKFKEEKAYVNLLSKTDLVAAKVIDGGVDKLAGIGLNTNAAFDHIMSRLEQASAKSVANIEPSTEYFAMSR